MARASAAQRGYGAKWRRESAAFLALPENRLCACGCGQPATVVDHRQPHRGDPRLFWSRSNWQGLAKVCHDGAKQREERQGFSDRVGADGAPTDPRHPFNRAEGGVAEMSRPRGGGVESRGSKGSGPLGIPSRRISFGRGRV